MADLSEVLTVLATTIAGAVYPNGTTQPSAVGVAVKVYPGWPNAQQLDADLRAATPVCHVSVYPQPAERNTTRYMPTWQQASINNATLVLNTAGQTVTVAGSIPPVNNPHVVSLLVNGKAYPYAVLTTDTVASIASALAALVAVDLPGATALGALITLPANARLLAARVGVTGQAVKEVRRQERRFQIGIWANTPANRDALAKLIDPILAATTFLTLPDGTAGRIVYQGSAMSDALQKDCLFRRDLFYTVEYGTTLAETETQITQGQLNVSASVAGVDPAALVATAYN